MRSAQFLAVHAAVSPVALASAMAARNATATAAVTAATPSCVENATVLVNFEKQSVGSSPENGVGFVNWNGFTVITNGYDNTEFDLAPKSAPNFVQGQYPVGSSLALNTENFLSYVQLKSFWWACSELLSSDFVAGSGCSIEVITNHYDYGIATYGPFTPKGNTNSAQFNAFNMTKATMPDGVFASQWWFVVTDAPGRYGSLYMDNFEMYEHKDCEDY